MLSGRKTGDVNFFYNGRTKDILNATLIMWYDYYFCLF